MFVHNVGGNFCINCVLRIKKFEIKTIMNMSSYKYKMTHTV